MKKRPARDRKFVELIFLQYQMLDCRITTNRKGILPLFLLTSTIYFLLPTLLTRLIIAIESWGRMEDSSIATSMHSSACSVPPQ